jgi:phenylpropionate dioxygenase-like ring-hydroxylating dioxygenase large terminal subunit
MLTHEENEEITSVGPGTLMGGLFREYWLPFLPSGDLEADGRPKRIRLLGEDLIAFRDSDSRFGLVDHVCAHRGAPMFFARNEECGLRCVYHGWKYDVDGRVVDTPAEPERSRFKDRVQLKAYRVRERNGILWAYLGSAEQPPELPEMEWNLVPQEQLHVSFRVQKANWLQCLEGEIDSAHAPILHGRVDGKGWMASSLASADLRPVFDCVPSDSGVSIAARRHLPDGQLYYRVNQFVMPFYSLVPPQTRHPELSGHAWVPMDDEHTLCIMFTYHPTDPLPDRMREVFQQGNKGRESGHPSEHAFTGEDSGQPFAGYWPKFTPENDYRYDAELERTYFSGIPGLWLQDSACQTGFGPIQDRTQEHLCSSDAGIVMTRRYLLDAARGLRDNGVLPPTLTDPNLTMVRAVSLRLADGVSWVDAGRDAMRAKVGAGWGYEL